MIKINLCQIESYSYSDVMIPYQSNMELKILKKYFFKQEINKEIIVYML